MPGQFLFVSRIVAHVVTVVYSRIFSDLYGGKKGSNGSIGQAFRFHWASASGALSIWHLPGPITLQGPWDGRWGSLSDAMCGRPLPHRLYFKMCVCDLSRPLGHPRYSDVHLDVDPQAFSSQLQKNLCCWRAIQHMPTYLYHEAAVCCVCVCLCVCVCAECVL